MEAATTATQTAAEWIAKGLDLRTVMTLLILVSGWIANWATQRAELADHERRIVAIETEIVPRSEHQAKDTAMNQRLDSIESLIREMMAENRAQQQR